MFDGTINICDGNEGVEKKNDARLINGTCVKWYLRM